MKIHRALLVSLISIAAVIALLRNYGLNRHLKVRVHPLLERISEIQFSPDPSLWKTDAYSPYLKIYEHEGELVYFHADEEQKLESALEQIQSAYLIAIIKESERVNYLLNELIAKYNLDDKVLVASKYRNVILNVRQVKPRWLTAVTPNELFLSIILNKFYLASLSPFKSSILVIDPNLIANEWINEVPWQELVRRNYHVIAPKDFPISIQISRSDIH